jgi:predicted amino acid racemase
VEAVVLLMVDMGDIREGIWFENREYLEEAVKQTLELPNLELYGLGTNFSCYGNVQPTVENGRMFVQIARELEAKFGIKFKYISGGNCRSYHLIEKGTICQVTSSISRSTIRVCLLRVLWII